MAPGYPAFACSQNTELSKSTDRRKHLNLLIHDYSEENKRLYGSMMPTAGSLLKPVRDNVEDPRPKYQALEGDAAVSRQLAAQVNNKRTPTGQFFTTINPTLWERQAPPATYDGQNVTDTAVATVRGGSGRLSASLGSDARMAPEHAHSHGGSIGADASGIGGSTMLPPIGSGGNSGSEGRRSSWLLPWQTGDRQLGKAMADSIRNKRTPIGAFANRDLAKPNK
ncbi:hypothetical protein PLESTB_000873900 [Pleodorina starrii]|uniref:Uncharacterized protein n=1 Tax=Pleodorina starrii TaxID=330485 RepID=A0A9W6BMK3_9CHLO|nr:hypothetical protein PLESTM_001752300 [Pleodorina starrii]GLC54505.1 hypothetical protein PLESTB_000873900 [Pleodorina starrii]GLC76117.1 hypothetical protein PLESTF_001736700 [Pleodorina starrii]